MDPKLIEKLEATCVVDLPEELPFEDLSADPEAPIWSMDSVEFISADFEPECEVHNSLPAEISPPLQIPPKPKVEIRSSTTKQIINIAPLSNHEQFDNIENFELALSQNTVIPNNSQKALPVVLPRYINEDIMIERTETSPANSLILGRK
jgi:hypothetical protein